MELQGGEGYLPEERGELDVWGTRRVPFSVVVDDGVPLYLYEERDRILVEY